jgi:CheY-like chemotaxis protein
MAWGNCWRIQVMEEQTKRVLLVEDDRFLRKAAEVMLRRHGFTIYTAVDGEEALRMARSEGPDLILLDLIMPKLQGFEVLRILKQDPTTRQIPIVVLSNLGQESDVQQALQGGAAAYFIKSNFSLQELVIQVQKVLQGGSAV